MASSASILVPFEAGLLRPGTARLVYGGGFCQWHSCMPSLNQDHVPILRVLAPARNLCQYFLHLLRKGVRWLVTLALLEPSRLLTKGKKRN